MCGCVNRGSTTDRSAFHCHTITDMSALHLASASGPYSEDGGDVILTLYIDGSSRRNEIDVCPPSRLHRDSVPYEVHAGFYSVIEE
jgi:hypothetical protein